MIAFLLDRGGGFGFCLFDPGAVMVGTHIVVWYWYIIGI